MWTEGQRFQVCRVAERVLADSAQLQTCVKVWGGGVDRGAALPGLQGCRMSPCQLGSTANMRQGVGEVWTRCGLRGSASRSEGLQKESLPPAKMHASVKGVDKVWVHDDV